MSDLLEFFAFRDYVNGFTTDSFGSLRWSGGGLHFVSLDK